MSTGTIESQPLSQVNLEDANAMYYEVLHGLQQPQKYLPCKYFYDEYGSKLFDQICDLEEYYPTRTETHIMERSVKEIISVLGCAVTLVEYGSGSSLKTRILLDNLPDLSAYIPIDISGEHLQQTAQMLARRYPTLEILPVTADYTQPIIVPTPTKPSRQRVVYFPGSTIGNFNPTEALAFLRRIADVVGKKGGLLIGVDLKKDPQRLRAAYNDKLGITAAFNLNILTHINHKLGSNFKVDQFTHHAFYNQTQGRIEMHLLSDTQQTVQLNGSIITFEPGETIWTESSYKYTVAEFATLAQRAGFTQQQVWLDEAQLFSVQYYLSV